MPSKFSTNWPNMAYDINGRLVTHNRLVAARCCHSQLNRFRHSLGPHVCAELPGDDITAVIVEDRAEVKPTPADDLEVGCLPDSWAASTT